MNSLREGCVATSWNLRRNPPVCATKPPRSEPARRFRRFVAVERTGKRWIEVLLIIIAQMGLFLLLTILSLRRNDETSDSSLTGGGFIALTGGFVATCDTTYLQTVGAGIDSCPSGSSRRPFVGAVRVARNSSRRLDGPALGRKG